MYKFSNFNKTRISVNKKICNIKKLLRKNRYSLLLYLSGVLIGICFVITGVSWLLFVGLPLLFLYVEQIRNFSLKRVMFDFFLLGLIVSGTAHSFMFQVAVENWQAIARGWFVYGSMGITWVIATLPIAFIYSLVGWLLYKIRSKQYRLLSVIIIWPIFEWLRSYFFAILSYGKGGHIADNFNFDSFSVIGSGTPFVYVSRLLGFWGISVALLVIGYGLFQLIRRRYLIASISLGVALTINVSMYYLIRNKDYRNLKVVMVHLAENDALTRWQDFNQLPNGIDLLVLPEYSEATDSKIVNKVASKLSENGVGVTTVTDGKAPNMHNQLIYFDHTGKIISKQNKTLLIPTGEYLPWVIENSFKLAKQKVLLDTFTYTQTVKAGTNAENAVEFSGIKYGALPCSGVTSPYEYKRLKKQGANILINTASLSFMDVNSTYHVYGANMARFQAVSNGLPFIQASRSGRTYALDAKGNIIAQADKNKTNIQIFNL